MRKTKLLLVTAIMAICQFGFGQQQQKEGSSKLAVKITKEEYNSISKSVKTFSYNPTYFLRVSRISCTYEIFVNDMLVDFSFETGNSAGEQTAGFAQYILKSGKQKIKVKVYPKAMQAGKLESTLSPDADLSVQVVHFEFSKGRTSDAPQAYAAKLPKLSYKLPYFEWTGEFIADVPYALKGWSDGVDLSKENQQGIEKEVLEACERYKRAFEQKDVSTIANMIYNREKEIAQAYFFVPGKKGNYDHGWEKLEQETKNTVKMNPITGYSMHFFGDGKVIALLQNSGENRDFPVLFGETADQENFYGLLFYRPKPGARLEVIR